jgi:hypothetical protein
MGENLIPSSHMAPYTLPLDREAFQRAVRLGLGRALLHAEQHGVSGLIDVLAQACMESYEFNTQLGGGRSEWLLAIIRTADAEQDVADLVVGSWRPKPESDQRYADDNQLCEILLAFAKRGHTDSGKLLRRVFRIDVSISLLVGGAEIIELEGVDGLRFVCERMMAGPDLRPNIYFARSPVRYMDELHGEGEGLRMLEHLKESDALIASYLEYLRSHEEINETPEQLDDHVFEERRRATLEQLRSTPADEVVDAIRNKAPDWPRTRLSAWGREASDRNLRQILDAILDEDDTDNIRGFFSVFRRRPLPEFDDRLLTYVVHDCADVRVAASGALAQTRHSAIRELALRCLREGMITDGQLELFKLNGEHGDAARIERSIFLPDELFELHAVILDTADLCKTNPTIEFAGLMRLVYEHSPCGLCRSRVVESLLKADTAPDWLLREAAFDASEDVRRVLDPETDDDS